MTKIEAAQVRHVADLANLGLGEEEISMLTRQLDEILQYVAQLDELETSKVMPTTHAVPMVCPLRDDQARDSDLASGILATAPAEQDAHFVVPKIMD